MSAIRLRDGKHLLAASISESDPTADIKAAAQTSWISSGTKPARTMQKRQQYENLEELAAFALPQVTEDD
jgi:hypothetical protein